MHVYVLLPVTYTLTENNDKKKKKIWDPTYKVTSIHRCLAFSSNYPITHVVVILQSNINFGLRNRWYRKLLIFISVITRSGQQFIDFCTPQIAYTSGCTLKNVDFTDNLKSYSNFKCHTTL